MYFNFVDELIYCSATGSVAKVFPVRRTWRPEWEVQQVEFKHQKNQGKSKKHCLSSQQAPWRQANHDWPPWGEEVMASTARPLQPWTSLPTPKKAYQPGALSQEIITLWLLDCSFSSCSMRFQKTVRAGEFGTPVIMSILFFLFLKKKPQNLLFIINWETSQQFNFLYF